MINVDIAQEDDREENKEQNNQELEIFKELSFLDYLEKKRNKQDSSSCSCCSCCFNPCCNNTHSKIKKDNSQKVTKNDFLKFYNNFRNDQNSHNRCITAIDFLLLIFNIIALCLSIYLIPVFKNLKNTYSRRLDDINFNFEAANIYPKYDIWYTLSKMEIGVLVINTFISILFIIFDFLIKYKYDDIIIKKEKKIGKTTKKIIFFTFILFIFFTRSIFF